MSAFLQDLRFAARLLRRSGAAVPVAIVSLALGIGANTAIFSIVNAILLEPLPYERPRELVLIGERHGQRPISVSWLNYLDWKAEGRMFGDMGATSAVFLNLTRQGAEPERLLGARVTASYFSTLGVKPILGRTFTSSEDSPGGEPTVVLSEGTWRRLFGAEPAILGRTLTFSGTPYTIIGVMPAAFVVQNPPVEAWISLGRIGDQMGPRSNHSGTSVVARLKPGGTLEEARADLDAVAARLAAAYPSTNRDIGVLVDPLHDRLIGQDVTRALFVLAGAVGFVLLIACANVANLLLSRGAARQREIAIRSALGAGRARLMRQLLTESVLLAGAGGLAGVVLGAWGLRVLLSSVPDNLARIGEVQIDSQVLAFTSLLTLTTGVIFGIAPALHVSKPELTESLAEGGRGTGRGRRGHRLRSTLVVAQIALSLVLLVGAGLMLQSFGALQTSSAGIEPQGLVTGGVILPGARYAQDEPRRLFYRQVIDRLQATAGVEAVGAITPLPLSGSGSQVSLAVEGYPEPEPGRFPTTDIARVTPDYFRAMGVRLLRGRTFTWRDDENAPLVAIIDETFANTWFAGQDPIGQRIKLNAGHPPPGGPPPPWVTVVGVVNHVKHYGIDQESRIEAYVPFMQSTLQQLTLVLQARGADAAATGRAMRQAVAEADPTLPVFTIRTMDDYLARTLTSKQLLTIVLALFACVALTLAAVGVYGVMSYVVAQRTQEIGVRVALGAYRRDVLRLVVGEGMLLAGAGIVTGLCGAYILTRLVTSMLFGVSATDPLTFTAVTLLLIGVALVATWLPARRAARIDPIVALRRE